MGNKTTIGIAITRNIMFEITSGKVLTLNNVFYVPSIRNNLVSVVLLVKYGFDCVIVSDKALISNNELFIRKSYHNEGLFKLNVVVKTCFDRFSVIESFFYNVFVFINSSKNLVFGVRIFYC